MTQEIIVRENGNRRTKLAPFGSSAEIRELAKRILAAGTVNLQGGGSRKLLPVEAAMLASVCIAHGLDYFLGEVYGMLDKDGNFKVGAGRDAWVKAANKSMEKNGGGNFWFDERQIIDPAELMALHIPAGAIAYEMFLRDTISIREYSMSVERLSTAGAPWNDIVAILGNRPGVSGIGWYQPGEKTKGQDTKFTPAERAKKRARMTALKAKFNLPFDEFGEGTDELSQDYIAKLPKPGVAAETIVEQTGDGVSGTSSATAPADGSDYVPDSAAIDAALKAKRERDSKVLYGEG